MLNTPTFINLIHYYLGYLSDFGLMFSFHHEVKLKVLLHYEDTHILIFLNDVLF